MDTDLEKLELVLRGQLTYQPTIFKNPEFARVVNDLLEERERWRNKIEELEMMSQTMHEEIVEGYNWL